MEDLQLAISAFVQFMQIPFTIWGFTLSWWDIMLALLIGALIIYLIKGVLF